MASYNSSEVSPKPSIIPDLVLILGDDAPTFADRPEWKTVAAVRNRRFVFLQGSEFEYPSFRAFDAVRKLRGMLMEAAQ